MSYANKYIKSLYDRAPYIVKVFGTSVYGLQQRAKRFGKPFSAEYKLLEESQNWTEEKLEAYQQEKLLSFFSMIKNVPYYAGKSVYTKLFDRKAPISEFPILSKREVKGNSQQFYNTKGQKFTWGHTSGTTGSALIFPISQQAFEYEYAFRAMHYKWGGVDFKNRDKVAMCSGHPVALTSRNKPPFWSYDWANNHLFFSSYHLGNDTLQEYVQMLERFDPLLLHGYPSSIYLLALAYRKYKKGRLSLKAVYTSSETLLDFQRAAIEEAFGVKVYNWYGTSEMTANIVECECGELHVKSEHSYVEILNSYDVPCKPGETGRVVSTNFNNEAFPLIRYDIGDVVTVSINQVSKCGRSGLLIDHIQGRIEDYIITPEHRMIGRLDHLFKDAVNVMEAQIFQDNPEEITIRIVPSQLYKAADEITILNEARKRLGKSIRINFAYVDQIPRAASGKYKFIDSKIQPTGLEITV